VVSYISPTQVNILTAPDTMSGPVSVRVTVNGVTSAAFASQAQAVSPSLFTFSGVPDVAATHADGTYLGPTTLYPGATTPAKPGETIVLYANGFGAQPGILSPPPAIRIGGTAAAVQYAGLSSYPGLFQFNVVVPPNMPDGDQPIAATYSGQFTQAGTLIPVQH